MFIHSFPTMSFTTQFESRRVKEKLNLRINGFCGLEDAGNQQVNCIGSIFLALILYLRSVFLLKPQMNSNRKTFSNKEYFNVSTNTSDRMRMSRICYFQRLNWLQSRRWKPLTEIWNLESLKYTLIWSFAKQSLISRKNSSNTFLFQVTTCKRVKLIPFKYVTMITSWNMGIEMWSRFKCAASVTTDNWKMVQKNK